MARFSWYENECVGCETCVNCGAKKVKYNGVKCDKEGCNNSSKDLDMDFYDVDGEDVCEDCLFKMFAKVEL